VHPNDMIGRLILLRGTPPSAPTSLAMVQKNAEGGAMGPAAAEEWRVCTVRQWVPSTGMHWVTPLAAATVPDPANPGAHAEANIPRAPPANIEARLVDLTAAGRGQFTFHDQELSTSGGGGRGGGSSSSAGNTLDKFAVAANVPCAIQQNNQPMTQQPQQPQFPKLGVTPWSGPNCHSGSTAAPQAWVEDEESPFAQGNRSHPPARSHHLIGGELTHTLSESVLADCVHMHPRSRALRTSTDCVQIRAQRNTTSFDLFVMVGNSAAW